MSWFEYEGLTPGGTAIAGRIEAVDRERAADDLAELQIEVRQLAPASPPGRKTVLLTGDDLIFFNEQLASLASAGIALDEGLAQLARDIHTPRLRKWIDGLVQDLRAGKSIDEAVKARERGLPILYSRVIRAGIDSGELPATLLNLNQHLHLMGSTRRLVWELASYPLLVLVLGVTVMSFFFVLVVPDFKDIFADFGTSLPVVTLLLIGISESYPAIMAGVILAVAGVVLLCWVLRLWPGGRVIRESIIMLIPGVGRIHRASLVSRFLRSVSTAIATGIPLPEAMRLGADATGSVMLTDDADRLSSEVEQGRSVFAASKTTRIIPPLFGYCVQVATGRDALPEAIGKLAMSYERRAMYSQAMLRTVLFPILIIIVGGFIFIGITGMFLPLVTLINSVSSGG